MLYEFIVQGALMFVESEEYEDVKKTLDYMGVEYSAKLVEHKMYAFVWHDYIDDEWSTIWCTEDEYKETLEEMNSYEVEYYIKEYN